MKPIKWQYVVPKEDMTGPAPKKKGHSGKQVELLRLRAAKEKRTPKEKLFRLWLEESGEIFADQVPVWGKYILDFLLPTRRLIVEIDGKHHYSTRTADRDDERTRDLVSVGTVLRLPNSMICVERKEEAMALVRKHVEFNAVYPDRFCWRLWASKSEGFDDRRITRKLKSLRESGEIAKRLVPLHKPTGKKGTIADLLLFGEKTESA